MDNMPKAEGKPDHTQVSAQAKDVKKLTSKGSQPIAAIIVEELIKNWSKWKEKKTEKKKLWRIFYRPNRYVILTPNGPLSSDITALCAIYTLRGPYLKSYIDSCEDGIREILVHLAVKYNLNGSPKIDCKPHTPSRSLLKIARCFPNVCCELYSIGIFAKMVPLNILGVRLKGKQQVILCPLFPLVASAELFKKDQPNILPQLMWIAQNTNLHLVKEFTQLNSFSTLFENIKKDLECELISEDLRRALCTKWGLLKANGLPNEIWLRTRNYCLRQLSKNTDSTCWQSRKELFDHFSIGMINVKVK